MAAKRPLIIIGTSGSHDYLKPRENDNKRFWPVMVPRHHERADPSTDPCVEEPDESVETHRDDPTKMEYERCRS